MQKDDDALSPEEVQRLVLSACSERPHTEEELRLVCIWAEAVRLEGAMLNLVLDGALNVFVGEDFKGTIPDDVELATDLARDLLFFKVPFHAL